MATVTFHFFVGLTGVDTSNLTTASPSGASSIFVASDGNGAADTDFAVGEAISLNGVPQGSYVGSFGDGIVVQNGSNFTLLTNDGTLGAGSAVPVDPAPFPVCFMVGTLIATPDGERAIETLRPGNLILTHSGRSRPVKWTGHRYVHLGLHPDPDTVRPIIFRAHSIADNVPTRDLSVSPGHAIYVDGGFVHAYRLVNGASIVLDRDAAEVTWYHIELESHDILLAEGAPAESFLDVGNRSGFANTDGPVDLHPNMMPPIADDWMAKACAPFLLDQRAVEPIWQRLMARAEQLGQGAWIPPQTTDDPALMVRANGRDVRPVVSGTGTYTFTVPATSGPVWLVSRATAPAALQPWVPDNRRLGVAVRGMTLRQGGDVRVIPLDHPALAAGWWTTEGKGSQMWRWTRGTALLPAMFNQPAVLTIETGPEASYEIATQAAKAA